MIILDIAFSLLPWICLGGTIWIFRLRWPESAFYAAALNGSLFWSSALWLETQIFSWCQLITAPCITIFWSFYLLLLCIGMWRYSGIWRRLAEIAGWDWLILTITVVTLLLGIVYPPNNYDTLTYHMPRVAHWLQNHTLAPYFTSIDRQIGMAPWNAMLVLQTYAPARLDYFVNMGQWLAFVGIISGVGALASQLGGDGIAQKGAMLFFATLPVAIIQASNTDSCLIVSFYICGMTWACLAWRRTGHWLHMLQFGLCLGFAILSKGSAYPIGLPFVLLVGWHCLKKPKKLLWQGVLAAALVIILNAPHLIRTVSAAGSLVASSERNIVTRPTPGTLLVNMLYNFISNEPVLMAGTSGEAIRNISAFLGVEQTDRGLLPWGGIDAAADYFVPSDGLTPNPFHAVLVPGCFIFIFLARRKWPWPYLGIALASGFFFCLLLTWHPWMTRIQIPLFMLFAPVFGLVLAEAGRAGNFIRIGLAICAIMPLLLCVERPLLPAAWVHYFRPHIAHFLNGSREKLIFNFNPRWYGQYAAGVDTVANVNPERIGLRVGSNGPEYPLWVLLAARMSKLPFIEHAKAGDYPVIFEYFRDDTAGQHPVRVLQNERILYPQR